MSDDELIEVAVAKGLTEQIVLDADGNLANREELVEALLESASATEAAIS
jgi:peptidoglycan-associated lipoprotein